MIDASSLARATGITIPAADHWAPLLAAACAEFGIDTVARQAAFVAQCAHESANFTRLVENTRYTSAERILKVFPSRFKDLEAAAGFVNNPQALANRVYAGRNGNGDEASGDGWRFRGRGLFQITGRANYRRVGTGLRLDLEELPSALETAALAARSAAWWWQDADLNEYADAGAIDKVSGVINRGDPNKRALGAAERAWTFAQGLEAFA